jgi:hypothetical protein
VTDGSDNRSPSFADVVGRALPGVAIVATSHPTPTLSPLNVIASFEDADDARSAVLALESLDDNDAEVALTVVSVGVSDDAPSAEGAHASADRQGRAGNRADADPEGVIADVTPRAVTGAIIGAIVGAIVVGGIAAAVIDGDGWIGAVLGGALFGSAIGATWGAFARFGGSDAYRQTFVDPSESDLFVVSLHVDDGPLAERARDRLSTVAGASPVVIDLR